MNLDGLFSDLEDTLRARARKVGSPETRRRLAAVAKGGLVAAALLAGPAAAQGQDPGEQAAPDTVPVAEVQVALDAYQEVDRLIQEVRRDIEGQGGLGPGTAPQYLDHLSALFRVLDHHGESAGKLAIADAVLDEAYAGGLNPQTQKELLATAGGWLSQMDRRDARVNHALQDIREMELNEARADLRSAERSLRIAEERRDLARSGQRRARKKDGLLGRIAQEVASMERDRSSDRIRDARREVSSQRSRARGIENDLQRLDRAYVPGIHTIELDEMSEEVREHLVRVHRNLRSGPDRTRAARPRL